MSHSSLFSFIWSSEQVWEVCRTEIIVLQEVALLAINIYVCFVGCILMGLFFAFCPNFYCGCRVEISTQEGGAAQCQPSRLKLELRCTTKGRRDPQGASPPSLFLSLLLLPLPFCFSSPPLRPHPFSSFSSVSLRFGLPEAWILPRVLWNSQGKAFLCWTTSWGQGH